jgi:hypothetical protein
VSRHYPRVDASLCPSPVGCARSTYHRNLNAGDVCECCGTLIYLQPDLDDDMTLYRTARKSYRCGCPGGNQPCPHADCRKDITPGDQYIEYVGEAGFAQSGVSYCMPCGVATWAKETVL